MAITKDILRSYRDPGGVVGRILKAGRREDMALFVLMLAALLIFIAQIPVARRAVILGEGGTDQPDTLAGQLSPYLFGIVFLFPLIAYALAGLSHLVARAMGGRGDFYGARVALFWSLLAVAPLMLLQGVVAGLAGPGLALTALGALIFAAFLWIWIGGLRAAEFGAGR